METALVAKKVLEQALIYEKRHGLDPLQPELDRQSLVALLDRVQRHFQKHSNPLRILEIGSGPGLVTAAIASLGHRVLGLEFQQETVHLAKFFVQEQNLDGLFLFSGELSGWEVEVEETLGGQPELVVLVYPGHRGSGIETLLQRLAGWLKPGRKLVILSRNPAAPMLRLHAALSRYVRRFSQEEEKPKGQPRSYAQWQQLLTGYGFEVSAPRGVTPLKLVGRLIPRIAEELVFEATRV